MAKKVQPKQGGSGKINTNQRSSKIGDSQGSMGNLRKAAEIPPKTGSGGKSKK